MLCINIKAQIKVLDIVGIIETKDKKPIGDMLIYIEDLAPIKSDINGKFSFRFPADKQILEIKVEKLGWSVAKFEYRKVNRSLRIIVRESKFMLLGKIEHSNHTPIVGAKIGVQNQFIETISKKDGRFSLVVPPGLDIMEQDNALTVNGKPIPKKSLKLDIMQQTVLIHLVPNQIFEINIKNQSGTPLSGTPVQVGSNTYDTDATGKIQIKNTIITSNQNIKIDKWKIIKKQHHPNERAVTIIVRQSWSNDGLETTLPQHNLSSYLNHNNSKPLIQDSPPTQREIEQDLQNHEDLVHEAQIFNKSMALKNRISSTDKERAQILIGHLQELAQKTKKYHEHHTDALQLVRQLKILLGQNVEHATLTENDSKISGKIPAGITPNSEETAYKNRFLNLAIISLLAIALVGLIIYASIKRKKYQQKDAEIKQQKHHISKIQTEIKQHNEEIKSYGEHLRNVREKLNRSNKNTKANILYAQTIQLALLPTKEEFTDHFSDFFILYKPKSIVSGDFYWIAHVESIAQTFVAVVDCTGHGVSGAFMSMIGVNILNTIIYDNYIYAPEEILTQLHQKVRTVLKQDQTANRDGMDLCLCAIEKTEKEQFMIQFSGAKRPLLYASDISKKIHLLKGSNKSIGGRKRTEKHFERQEIMLNKGDILYLTSDGLADQCNMEKTKFGMQNLTSILDKSAKQAMNIQKDIIHDALRNHQKNTEQRDDITVMGIQL